MAFIKGSVGIFAWGVMLAAGFSAGVLLLNGDIVTAVIAGLVAWGAWKTLEAVAVE